jgi:hypothetical protein
LIPSELKKTRWRIFSLVVLSVLLLNGLAAARPSFASSSTPHATTTYSKIIFNGVSSLEQLATASQKSTAGSAANPVQGFLGVGKATPTSTSAPASISKLQAPVVKTSAVQPATNVVEGFSALDALDSTYTPGNVGLTVTPPDQGLCVSSQYVMEPINIALTVYTHAGVELIPPVSLYSFMNIPPYPVNFPIGDVRCFHDPTTDRWFVSQLDVSFSLLTTGKGFSYLALAVSETSNPLGKYYLYLIPTVDNGSMGTPSDPGCPCFGDQPLIGMDANGLYISTNEYGNGPAFNVFNGAQIYAVDKAQLEAGTAATVVHINAAPDLLPFGDFAYSISPAMNAVGQPYAKNTELFLSGLDFTTNFDDRIAVWALSGTNTLSSATPTLSLVFSVIHSENYGVPDGWYPCIVCFGTVPQPNGPRPLAQSLGKGNNILEHLNGDDDRMQMVTYADGMLWSGLTSTVKTIGGTSEIGIAYFVVSPSLFKGGVGGTVVEQGYIAASGADVIYPSVGVNNQGYGAVSFTLSGKNNYPSAAYATISLFTGTGPIQVVAAGAGPLDDFSGYPAFGGNGVARWGDYSWAVAAPGGHIWVASEFIPDQARTLDTNYGTYITEVNVGP